MPVVRMPDGVDVSFPDDMPKEQIKGLILKKFPNAGGQAPTSAPAPVASPNITQFDLMTSSAGNPNRGSMTNSAVNLLTFGLGEKLGAAAIGGLDTLVEGGNYSDNYNRQLSQMRADQKAYEAENPKKAMAGKAVGLALGITSAPAFAAKQGARLAGRVGAVAKTGAAYGGVGGAAQDADTLNERLSNAGLGATLGGATAAALYPVAAGIGKVATALTGKGKAIAPPDVDQLRATKNALYDTAEGGIGKVKMTRDHIMKLARGFNEVGKESNAGGVLASVTDDVYKSTNSTIRKFNEIAGDVVRGKAPPPTFGELEKMRQNLNAFSRSAVQADGKISPDGLMATKLVDEIDDLLLSTPFKTAREAYRTVIKAEKIERAFYKAELATGANYTQAGMETAIKQQFKAIAADKNFNRTFSQAERDGILKVVKGGKLQNWFRRFGALAPKGGVSTMFNIGMTFANPAIGIPLGVGATASRYGSTAKTLSNARLADEMIRRGGAPAPPNPAINMTNRVNRSLQPGLGLLSPQIRQLLGVDQNPY